MKRLQLRSKDLSEKLKEYSITIDKKQQVELIDEKIILLNHEPSFFYYEKKIIPTLKYLQKNNLLKKITIDMGAIKFIINGADLMRPGITDFDQKIKKDDIICIIDINNKKPIAVGIALFNAPQMQLMTSGKVIKNIHYIGDDLWNFKP